ncbi:MAG TPA: HAMP domain-containing sensor histidine kinase [Acidimicrobiales bacterium]|nr:HAMP domain-containing sensor histidine kinase [Acidimicrobiales bacterium]
MSLRLRLLVAVGLISIAALVVADFATYSALRNSLYNQVDHELAQHKGLTVFINEVTDTIRLPGCGVPGAGGVPGQVTNGGPIGNSGAVATGDSGQGPTGNSGPDSNGGGHSPNVFGIGYTAIVKQSGGVVDGLECAAYVGDHSYRPQLPTTITGFTTQPDGSQTVYFTTGSIASGGPAFRVQATKVVGGPFQGDIAVQAQPLTDQTGTLHTLFLTELAVTAGAIVLALFGGWWLVRLGLRPLADVEATADAIAAGNLDQRVPGADEPTEVGRLARALNVMLERIQNAFDARVRSESRLKQNEQHLRQFVADASHELRTPIAAVSAYAELFERGAGTRSEDLPRIAAGIRTETARMDRLVSDLLTLARLDEGVPMEREPVELVALVSEGVHTATAVGPGWPVRFWAPHPVEVTGDKDRLRQVVDNLLANVRAHTPEGTAVTVRVDQVGDQAEIEVRDAGPGMPGDEARRIFERFYRSDPARARTRGGSGLGLSIVAAIVEAHGGTVTASSAPGQGMAVTVRIPNGVGPADPAPADDTPVQLAVPAEPTA